MAQLQKLDNVETDTWGIVAFFEKTFGITPVWNPLWGLRYKEVEIKDPRAGVKGTVTWNDGSGSDLFGHGCSELAGEYWEIYDYCRIPTVRPEFSVYLPRTIVKPPRKQIVQERPWVIKKRTREEYLQYEKERFQKWLLDHPLVPMERSPYAFFVNSPEYYRNLHRKSLNMLRYRLKYQFPRTAGKQERRIILSYIFAGFWDESIYPEMFITPKITRKKKKRSAAQKRRARKRQAKYKRQATKAKGTEKAEKRKMKPVPIEDRDPRRVFTKVQQDIVLQRQGFRCAATGKPLKEGEIEFDHIIPWAVGGRTTIDNCEALTTEAHLEKSRNLKWIY